MSAEVVNGCEHLTVQFRLGSVYQRQRAWKALMNAIAGREVLSGLDELPTGPAMTSCLWAPADGEKHGQCSVRVIEGIAQASDDPLDLRPMGRFDVLVWTR